MRLPDFLIIGAAKSGTTALANFLDRHPQVHIPFKEPSFFSGWTSRKRFAGPSWPKTPDPRCMATTVEEYAELFADPNGASVLGEASTSYLCDEDAPRYIRETMPDVKLIAILRQPVDHAFSLFMHLRERQFEPETEFMTAVDQELTGHRDGWRPHLRYIEHAAFSHQLERYRALFTPDQLHVFLFEDWRRRSHEIWREILDILGVDHTYMPDFSESINPSYVATPAFRVLVRGKALWMTMPRSLRRKLAPTLQSWLWHRPRLDPRLRAELTKRFYVDEIARLQEMLGRDLSHWLPR